MYLSLRLPQPLLLEGEAGVGKTEAAKSLAAVLDTPLIRLQCYDGIDAAEALYEWNYPRQLLSIRLADTSDTKLSEEDLFGPDYLIRRPLLRALEHPGPRPAVLLIDEIDRADDEFEAFLLELLADAAVTIPEIGTIRATHPPIVVLTSNRTRDLHDALKRRCLYHWIDYPTAQREVEIVRRRVKGVSEALAVQVAGAVARMRDSDVQKPPGVAEAIDWVAALDLLGLEELDEAAIDRTLGSVLKYSGTRGGPRGRAGAPGGAMTGSPFSVQTVHLDLPALAGAFSRRLREAGVPITAERAAHFAHALALVKPITRRRLYWTARAVVVSDPGQVKAFDAVFASVFGANEPEPEFEPEDLEAASAAEPTTAPQSHGETGAGGGDISSSTSGSGDEDGLRDMWRCRWPRATRSCCGASASTRSRPKSSRSSTG